MKKYNKMKARHPIRFGITLIVGLLFLFVPLSAQKQIEESHMYKRGEIPEDLGISYHVNVKLLDLIPPDKIEPTKFTNKHSKRYAPCDIMPKPIEASYEFIAYRHVNKDKNMYGTVLVHTLINKKGEVKKCIVAKTIQDSALVDILVEGIKNSSFHPAIRNNKPVDVWLGIPVKFTHRTLQIEF